MISLILTGLLSGAIYILSLTPWSSTIPSLSLLQWIAFVPLLRIVDQQPRTWKEVFVAGFGMNLGIAFGGFYWIIYAVQQYGGIPFAGALGVFAAFCFIAQIQIPLYLLARKKALQYLKPQIWIPLSGLIYAGIESIYPKLFLDTPGMAFADHLFFSQMADIGSVLFITVLVITFAESFHHALKQNRKWFALPALILAFGYGYGFYRVHQIDARLAQLESKPALRISAIQANIGDYLKIAAEQGLNNASEQVISEYLKYSQQAIDEGIKNQGNPPDALVWPETAYSALFGNPVRMDEKNMEIRLRDFAAQYPGTMIFGGYDRDQLRQDYNSIFFLPQASAQSEEKPAVYHKNVLLMFGETLPFADYFPSMKQWFPTMGFFGRGPGPEVYSVKNLKGEEFKLAPSVCYEGLFPYFSAKGASLGADALINVTNDSWFGPNGEPYLHFALTRFRSIETRRPMLRATNTGITAAIDPLGRLTGKTRLFVPETLTTTIHGNTEITSPYQLISNHLGGSWFAYFSELITVLTLIFIYFKTRRSSSKI